jgi:hypothetical protein
MSSHVRTPPVLCYAVIERYEMSWRRKTLKLHILLYDIFDKYALHKDVIKGIFRWANESIKDCAQKKNHFLNIFLAWSHIFQWENLVSRSAVQQLRTSSVAVIKKVHIHTTCETVCPDLKYVVLLLLVS